MRGNLCYSPWRVCGPRGRLFASRMGVSMTLRNLLRLIVLGCAFVTCTAPAPQAAAASGDAVAYLHPEVRLRKLHLVRPDLIHYPLSVEVVC
jgi:hypothetical protein